jgi:hypothetical protein
MKIRPLAAELIHADGRTDGLTVATKLIVAFRNFLDRFSKNTQISNFMKIRPLGAELIHADGRTDGLTVTTKLIVAFRNFLDRFSKYNKI